MPELTILMPVFNGIPYLHEAISSILSQTYREFTMLIVNDGSSDGSKETCLDRLTDSRIRVVHVEKNGGQGAAKNVGLDICDSEFIAIMDADDIALPTRLETQIAFLRRNAEVGLLGTQIAYLGRGGTGFSPPLPLDHEDIRRGLLKGRHSICHASAMCRTAVLRKIGGYRVDGIGEDWDMLLRISEASRVANLAQVLYLYRLNPRSVNVTHLAHIRNQIAYACDSARRRSEGLGELTFEMFVAMQRSRPLWRRTLDAMDMSALAQYRLALAEILDSHPVRGYFRLGGAALSSPHWTAQRFLRKLRIS